ncbi:MAG TPA: cytochrome b/b6 domain-containing protein [Candidatus Acidoferrum sp.]|nr:cytochrome b/b6 domain-containing protein [Candidatus Acidoferrum sp.]
MATLRPAQLSVEVTAPGSAAPAAKSAPRHFVLVRVTHWIVAFCFFALLLTGIEILISHPRFYWGETGNVHTKAFFQIPIPSSRDMVQTGYNYVLPDQNGWSRYLHFEAAWILVLTGLLYGIFGFFSGHFRKNLLPAASDLSWRSLSAAIADHSPFKRPGAGDASSYNVLQRLTYLLVVFVLFPLVIWTGLAMSPAFTGIFPATATLLGGRQSARTIHFFVSIALVLFLIVHIVMIFLAGFWSRTWAMIAGRPAAQKERT